MKSLTKPLLGIGILCAVFALSYLIASAQTTTTASSTEPATTTGTASPEPNPRQARLEEAVVAAGQNTILSASRQKRIINLAANLSNRMDAVYSRFENIANRLESRMLKLEESGADTSAARVALEDARSSLSIASSLLKDIDTMVIASVTSNDPQKSISELRATYESIATALKQAHSGLRISLSLLRTAPFTPPETSTSTEPAPGA